MKRSYGVLSRVGCVLVSKRRAPLKCLWDELLAPRLSTALLSAARTDGASGGEEIPARALSLSYQWHRYGIDPINPLNPQIVWPTHHLHTKQRRPACPFTRRQTRVHAGPELGRVVMMMSHFTCGIILCR